MHLDAVKTQIFSNENLRVDFPKCVSLFSDFIKQKQAADGLLTCTIAQVSRKQGPAGSLVQVEDRYYNTKEYHALTPKQKLELHCKCKNHGHKPSDKSSKKAKAGGDDLAKGIVTISHTGGSTIRDVSVSSYMPFNIRHFGRI